MLIYSSCNSLLPEQLNTAPLPFHSSIQRSSQSNSSIPRGLTTIRYASSKSKYSSDLVRSVRAMPIKLVTVGKGNSQAATAMAQEWITKLARQVGDGLAGHILC